MLEMIVAYPARLMCDAKSRDELGVSRCFADFKGDVIGQGKFVSTWLQRRPGRLGRPPMRMYSARVIIDEAEYYGRGQGVYMPMILKPVKKKRLTPRLSVHTVQNVAGDGTKPT